MRLPFLAAAVCAIAFASLPARAQFTGSHLGKEAGPKDAPAAMQIIGDCLAKRRPGFIARWFQLLPGTPEEFALVKREEGDIGICTENNQLVLAGKLVEFDPVAIRLPVARAAAQLALKNAPEQSPAPANSDPWFIPSLNALAPGAEVNKPYLAMLDFGHCVAVHDWPGAIAFLRAKPGSPEEGAAGRRLAPVLGPCLTADSKVAITPARLRDMLSEPVLHLIKGWGAAAPSSADQSKPKARN